jgi:hypothetical protein
VLHLHQIGGLNPAPTPPPPPLHQLTVKDLIVTSMVGPILQYFGKGGGQREGRGATEHKYSSFVDGGNSSQAGSKIPNMSQCISSP